MSFGGVEVSYGAGSLRLRYTFLLSPAALVVIKTLSSTRLAAFWQVRTCIIEVIGD